MRCKGGWSSVTTTNIARKSSLEVWCMWLWLWVVGFCVDLMKLTVNEMNVY
jgi:hypothetical protein